MSSSSMTALRRIMYFAIKTSPTINFTLAPYINRSLACGLHHYECLYHADGCGTCTTVCRKYVTLLQVMIGAPFNSHFSSSLADTNSSLTQHPCTYPCHALTACPCDLLSSVPCSQTKHHQPLNLTREA
ncbi:hypothetical protein BDR03DRAFT_543625 [Suillus americanus]|nr:hypothetical protein BDR03DRAFT_543625 [Suillus americanus]